MSNFVWQFIVNPSPKCCFTALFTCKLLLLFNNLLFFFSPCMKLGFLYDLCDLLNQNLALEKLIIGGFQEKGY